MMSLEQLILPSMILLYSLFFFPSTAIPGKILSLFEANRCIGPA